MTLLGIDIGGTFTDVVLSDPKRGRTVVSKVPTTPDDLTRGVLNGVVNVLREGRAKGNDIEYACHGTTVATNAIIEAKGAKTALLVTKGFRDIPDIRRRSRPIGMIYDPHLPWPEHLVPRFLRFEVDERVNHLGETLRTPKYSEIASIIKNLKAEEIESVAVCFLFSFMNGKNEQLFRARIQKEMPNVYVTLSSEILPRIKEYERMSTTIANSYVGPIVTNYITRMQQSLKNIGLRNQLFIMQSNGGVTNVEDAQKRPAAIVESGPVAGVVAAVKVGKEIGVENIISLDMGGTTTKACLVVDGSPNQTDLLQLGGVRRNDELIRQTGHEIALPTVEMVEIGSGGGSIIWIDKGQRLRVGPKSAGSDPGPACYGKGVDPTITDADLVLGYLDSKYFLGGKMPLSLLKAKKSLKLVADELGKDVVDLAAGAFKISGAQMSDTIGLVSTKRGYDPREFTLVAFGGAGPVHSPLLMEDLGISKLIVPPYPGLHSATGLTMSDLILDYVQTYLYPIDQIQVNQLENHFKRMEKQGIDSLHKSGMKDRSIFLLRTLDLRYEEQGSELGISLPPTKLTKKIIEDAVERFHEKHRETYGFNTPGDIVEVVMARLRATGLQSTKKVGKEISKKRSEALKGKRDVYFEKRDGFVKTPVYDRRYLRRGILIHGPSLIEQVDTTIVVPPNFDAVVDEYENIIVTKA